MRSTPPTVRSASRRAVQELARQEGKLATFMAKPFNDEGGSGFHLHFSTWSDGGRATLFDDPDGERRTVRRRPLGDRRHPRRTRRRWPRCSNPTINSYKRFGPDTLAPWLIDWGLDNRSAMVRIPPERGPGLAHGAPARRCDAPTPTWRWPACWPPPTSGIRDKLEPPAPLEGYGYDPEHGADAAPATCATALDAFEADTELRRRARASSSSTTFLTYKRNELERFSRCVTDWEFREYAYHL